MKSQSLVHLMRLTLSGFILFSIPYAPQAFATERGEVRRSARDTRQTGRDDSRSAKQECRAADEKSNAACRREKRNSKQQNREEARDIKY